jgi:hypothetical protein
MARKYSRAEIMVGGSVSLLLLIGFSAAAWYCITHPIHEPEPHARFAAIWFSLMMALMALSGVLRFASLRVRRLALAASLAWCAGIALFGLAFILIGLSGEAISGGMPFLPRAFNQALGSMVFVIAGVVILLLIPRLFRHQQEHG